MFILDIHNIPTFSICNYPLVTSYYRVQFTTNAVLLLLGTLIQSW